MKPKFTIFRISCSNYRLIRRSRIDEQGLTEKLFSAFSEPVRLGHTVDLNRRGKTTLNKEQKNLVFGAAAVYGIELDDLIEDDCDGAW